MSDIDSIPFAKLIPAPTRRGIVLTFGLLSWLFGFCANAIPCHFVLSMWNYPPGTAMRPMVEVAVIFLGAVAGIVIVLPLAAVCLVKGRRWWVGWMLGGIGCLLALSPWFLNNGLFNWIVAKRGFVMEP